MSLKVCCVVQVGARSESVVITCTVALLLAHVAAFLEFVLSDICWMCLTHVDVRLGPSVQSVRCKLICF